MEGIITLNLIMIKNWKSGRIKADTSARKEIYVRQLTYFNSDTKSIRDAGNESEPDMSVLRVIF